MGVFVCIARQVYDFDVPCTDCAIALSRSALARISQHASCKIVGCNLYNISIFIIDSFRTILKTGHLLSHGFSSFKHVPWSDFRNFPILGTVINPQIGIYTPIMI